MEKHLMNKEQGDIMRFIIVSDTHFYTGGHGKSSPFWSQPLPHHVYSIAQDLAARINSLAPDFVIHCGDLIDRPHRENVDFAQEWISSLNCPCHLAIGNHETMDATERDEIAAIFDLPRLPDGSCHSTKQVGEIIFLFLDNCFWLTQDGLLMPYRDQSLYETGRIRGMVFSDRELAWLEEELEKSRHRPVVIVSHAPLAFREKLPVVTLPRGQAADPSGTDADGFAKDLKMELLQREKALTLIKRYPHVKVAFSGHWHLHDAYTEDGILFCQTGAMREYPFEFRVVDVDGDRMTIETQGLSDPHFAEESYMPERGNAWVAGTHDARQIEISLQ